MFYCLISSFLIWFFIVGPKVILFGVLNFERLWPHGFSEIGSLTFESAAYVARYITKKWLGEGADEVYSGRLPEYITMSRRPGIGRLWIDSNLHNVYPVDRLLYGRVY